MIDMAINSLQDDEYSGPPDLESYDKDQGSVNVTQKFEVQDDGIIEYNLHNINIMAFPDVVIQIKKQTGGSMLPVHW